jgi:hypothetical protein
LYRVLPLPPWGVKLDHAKPPEASNFDELLDLVQQHELSVLDLGNCGNLTDEHIKRIPKTLEKLVLMNCKNLTNDVVKLLPRDIRHLNLNQCFRVTTEGLKYLL